MKPKLFIIFVAVFLLTCSSRSAEYEGKNIDGSDFDATAYSYNIGKYYNVTASFDGDEATIDFSNGHSKTLTLEDEEIDDPHSIDAYDYEKGVYWELNVNGLD
jgi:hypothetical protein